MGETMILKGLKKPNLPQELANFADEIDAFDGLLDPFFMEMRRQHGGDDRVELFDLATWSVVHLDLFAGDTMRRSRDSVLLVLEGQEQDLTTLRHHA